MRPIKFRAWDKIQKQMCYDVSVYSEIETESWWSADVRGESGNKIYSFEYGELMQFTGLTDKNGKEIYEGDIVGNDGKCFYRVVFENAAFVCYHTDLTNWDGRPLRWGLLSRFFEMEDIFHIEVIGNIYENPELL